MAHIRSVGYMIDAGGIEGYSPTIPIYLWLQTTDPPPIVKHCYTSLQPC